MVTDEADRPIRLLHLSDIHFHAGKTWDSDPVLRALVRSIGEEVQGGLRPDLVAITGDLAFAGIAAEYGLALEWLEHHLWPVFAPALPRDRLLLVPGNHDADRGLLSKGVRFLQDRLLDERSDDAVADLLRDDHERRGLLRRHDAYLAFYSRWLGADQPLPWWQRSVAIDGQRLHVAGLDSAWMACGDQDRGRLLLGRWQINQTVQHPDGEGADWRLALLHHPWDYLAEFDTYEARQAVHLHRDLVLRGHLHEGDASYVRPPDPARACLELAAGCCYDGSRHPNAFQWIELLPQTPTAPRRVRVLFRTWIKGAWQIDGNQPGCPDGKALFTLDTVFDDSPEAPRRQKTSVPHPNVQTGPSPSGSVSDPVRPDHLDRQIWGITGNRPNHTNRTGHVPSDATSDLPAQALRGVRVFIASQEDVTAERALTLAVLEQMNSDPLLRGRMILQPITWDQETNSRPRLATMTPQQAEASGRPAPADCEIVVFILWSHLGTPVMDGSTESAIHPTLSVTEWQFANAFDAFKATKRPEIFIYRRTETLNVPVTVSDYVEIGRQWQLVERFFQTIAGPASPVQSACNTYQNPHQFEEQLSRCLRDSTQRILDRETPTRQNSGLADDALEPVPYGSADSPYPGLRAFESSESRIYCGRGQEIDDLIKKLDDPNQRFIMVVGASGSGKSSLVAAGVVPRLASGAVDGSQQWVLMRFTPADVGDNPFMALAVQLKPYLKPGGEQTREVAERIANDPATFVQFSNLVLAGRPNWSELFLFIDQFEELFTLAKPDHVDLFLDWICATARNDRVRIIATIRADFYHLCVAKAPLAILLRDAHYPLAAPGLVELTEMITLPAQRAGMIFEKDLVNTILKDTAYKPGGLALLAFALAELYRARTGNQLSRAAYQGFGGVEGAITNRARDTLERLPTRAKESLDKLFGELVGVDEQGIVTRQPAVKHRLIATIPSAEILFDALINKARLLVASQRPDGEPVVEIAHESLFKTWDRLAKWVEVRYDDLVLLRQMKNAAEDWGSHERADAYLWPHERLKPLRDVICRLDPELSPLHQEFIRAEPDRLQAEIGTETTSHYRRALIGSRLAQIGDTRKGVGSEEGICEIEWCAVSNGRVRLRPTLREFDIDVFWMAKYPITWAQYELFVAATATVTKLERPAGYGCNYPVVGASWFDAVGFCRWLSLQRGLEVRLPTEWEWQLAAAGGSADRDYPWGSVCDLDRANSFESRLRQATAVGMYPHGASPFGVMDMAGNVWEWCSNTIDTLELVVSPSDRVAIRGGSWRNNLTVGRTWYRNHGDPIRGQDCVGFRVVTSWNPCG